MPSSEPSESSAGLAFGLGAYAFWGLAPLFWRQLSDAPALELLAHRVAWAFVFFVAGLLVRRQISDFLALRRQFTVTLRLAGTAMLLSSNWFLFVYAVNTDRVLDASLGYFINPLVSVALGRVFLGERLGRGQTVAVVIAAGGIALGAAASGGLPWISLALAASFGLYGLVRKTTPVSPLAGSTAEAMLVMPLSIAYLVWLGHDGAGTWGARGMGTDLLLIATGPITAIPLILFVNAARRLKLSTLGFLQYVAPSFHFVLGVAVFGEPLDAGRLAAFGVVWVALVVYTLDGLAHRRRTTSTSGDL